MKYKYKVTSKNEKSVIVNPRSSYSLDYIRGQVTEAKEGTLGIMVFDTKRDALDWVSSFLFKKRTFIIKRVIPLSRGKRENIYICSSIKTERLNEFYKYGSNRVWVPPPGTACYKKVLVVD